MSSSSTVRSRKDGPVISEAEAATVLEKAERNGGDDVTNTTATTATAAAANGEGEAKATKLTPPPPEQPAHVFRRSLIIASFWLVVLCLGLPIWWKTTAIPRANLPLQQMMSWAEGKVSNTTDAQTAPVSVNTIDRHATRCFQFESLSRRPA